MIPGDSPRNVSIARCPAKKGDAIWTFFDTGAMGAAILVGRVVASGPRAFIVEWESGFRNRIAQNCNHVHHVVDLDWKRA